MLMCGFCLLQEEHLEGLTNEDLLQAVWRINSLQRSLSIMALTWASCLHDAAAAAYPGKLWQGSATPMPPRPSGASLSQVLTLIFLAIALVRQLTVLCFGLLWKRAGHCKGLHRRDRLSSLLCDLPGSAKRTAMYEDHVDGVA